MPLGFYYGPASAIYRFENNLNDSYGSNNLTCLSSGGAGTPNYGRSYGRFGSYGIQMSGEYCNLASNFGWDLHQSIAVKFWLKCDAAPTGTHTSNKIVQMDDTLYKGGFYMNAVRNSGNTGFYTYLVLAKYDGMSTTLYPSSSLTGGTYGKWYLFSLCYTYSGGNYNLYLYKLDPENHFGYQVGSVSQAAYTGTSTSGYSDRFNIGDITSLSTVTVCFDEVIVGSAWYLVDLQAYYTSVASGLRGPKAMF